MIPPYEIISLLQLGISDASVFKNIFSNEVIIDKKFSTFSTVEGLIEMIVFFSDKITRVSIINYNFCHHSINHYYSFSYFIIYLYSF